MHPDDMISFAAKDSMWDKEMLKKYVKEDKEEWETYDATTRATEWYWRSPDEVAWSITSDPPKTSYNISEEVLEEAIDNIKVLLHATIDVKTDLNELKEIVREGFFAALKEEEKSSAKMYI